MSRKRAYQNPFMEHIVKELRRLELEEMRRLELELYRRNPFAWLKDRFQEGEEEYHWSMHGEGYKSHDWDGDEDPLYNAWKDIANGEWVAIKAATGTSKTYMLSRLVFWFLDVYEDALVVTSAPSEAQLRIGLWSEISRAIEKFKRLRPYTRLTAKSLKPEGNNVNNPYVPYLNSYQAIPHVSGVGADEVSATKAQGFHRQNMLIICEEAAGMNPAVMTAFQNTCTGINNIMVAVGNPDNEVDQLHQFSVLPNVNSYRVSAYDYPNVVLNNEVYHGAVTNVSIDRRLKKYGEDSPLYLSRVRGFTPAEGNDTLIRRIWVRNAKLKEFDEEKLDGSYNGIGIDVANSEEGDKASVICSRQNIFTSVQEFQCPNASHLAYNLMMSDAELINKGYTVHSTPKLADYEMLGECVGVDSVGVGVSTLNTFHDNDVMAIGLQGGQLKEILPTTEQGDFLYEFSTLRDQMYWELREDLREGKIFFYIEDEEMYDQLVFELSIPKFKLDRGKVAIESKKDIKKRMGGKSPNVADAMAYANWMRKGYYVNSGDLPFIGG